MGKLVRLQVEITQEQMDRLERLQALAGLRTKKELLDNALTLFQWALKEKALGASILSVHEMEKSCKELEMPCLEHAVSSDDPSISMEPTSQKPSPYKKRKNPWGKRQEPALHHRPKPNKPATRGNNHS